jgi:glycerophosphoryl diester phosphodiesterase
MDARNRVRVLGHRGVPVRAPENTLKGFRAALAEGADGVELDVRLCATGELVVCHDATLARFTRGANVRIRATSAWSLRQWDIGEGERVPLLREVLPLMRGRVLNVEVKSDDGDPEELAYATAREVTDRAALGVAVIVSSFEPAVLVALRRFAPTVPRGLLLSDDPWEAADGAARAGAVLPHAIHPHHGACTAERVASWKALGAKVNTWTVDDPADLRRVVGAGVDGVITNRTREMLGVLAQL